MTSARQFTDKIEALGLRAGVKVSDSDGLQLFRYYELLTRWNEAVNLTALPLTGYPDQTLKRLIIEPIVASELFPKSDVAWLDIGSGGGSPAIPLKVLRPWARLTLTEPRHRKVAFLREVIRALELRDVQVIDKRAEDGAAPPGSMDVVTVRAVRMDAILLEAVSSCLKRGKRTLFSFGVALSEDAVGRGGSRFHEAAGSPFDLRGIAREPAESDVNLGPFRPLFVYDYE